MISLCRTLANWRELRRILANWRAWSSGPSGKGARGLLSRTDMLIEDVFNSDDAPSGDATARDLRGRIVGRVGARFRGQLVHRHRFSELPGPVNVRPGGGQENCRRRERKGP